MTNNHETLWAHFRNYVTHPYRKTAQHLASVTQWHDDLYQRQKDGEDLRLDFVRVCHETSGRKFSAFRLNEQMYISTNPAVLTLPHPRTTEDCPKHVFPDKFVGIYLRDFGYQESFITKCRGELKTLPANENSFDVIAENSRTYPAALARKVRKLIRDGRLPGGQANNFTRITLRYGKETPLAALEHVDAGMRDGPSAWGRIIIHPVIATGTRFFLSGNDSRFWNSSMEGVTCPVGATSSHLGLRYNAADEVYATWGIYHGAKGHPDGRVVVCIGDHERYSAEPLCNAKTPWKIKPASTAILAR